MSDGSDAKNDELLRAYSVCFNGAAGQIVLTDLVAFCRGVESCVVPGDINSTCVLEGRREVLLRIQRYARLTFDEIVQLRLGRIRPKAGE